MALIAKKVREEMARRFREDLSRPQFPAIWAPLTTLAYEEARHLREILLRECRGRSLLDLDKIDDLIARRKAFLGRAKE